MLKINQSKGIENEESAKKRKGCGIFQRSRSYVARLYNNKTKEDIWTSPEVEACSGEKVIKLFQLCMYGLQIRRRSRQFRQCKNYIRQNFEEGLGDRLERMRTVAGTQCELVKGCQ